MRIIQGNEQASEMIKANLASAAKASLLLLPERFSAQELYTTVAGLSYTGEWIAEVNGNEGVSRTRTRMATIVWAVCDG